MPSSIFGHDLKNVSAKELTHPLSSLEPRCPCIWSDLSSWVCMVNWSPCLREERRRSLLLLLPPPCRRRDRYFSWPLSLSLYEGLEWGGSLFFMTCLSGGVLRSLLPVWGRRDRLLLPPPYSAGGGREELLSSDLSLWGCLQDWSLWAGTSPTTSAASGGPGTLWSANAHIWSYFSCGWLLLAGG